MAVEDVVLNEYTDKIAAHDTPVKKTYVTELRTNVQNVVTALDKHAGMRGDHEHARVTEDENGFFYPELLDLIDQYKKDLDDIENLLSEDDFPPYSIAIWSGELGNVPANWAVCDGSNGTPDLRQRIAVGWSGARPIGKQGGSFSHQVNSAVLMQNHTHTFHNIVGVYSKNGGYETYTKFGKWSGEIFPTGTGGSMYCFKETSTTTGSASAKNVKFNVVTPYICKYYIMRLPVESKRVVETYTVNIEAGEGTKVLSNLGGPGKYTVNKGSQLILSMTVSDPATHFSDGLYINNKKVSEDIIMYVYEDTNVVSKATPRETTP